MPKTGIVTFTKPAAEVGRQLVAELEDCHLYLNEKFMTGVQPGIFPYQEDDPKMIPDLLANYQQIILISSTANAIARLTPHLRFETGETAETSEPEEPQEPPPAVVVIDEGGHFSISLFGGRCDEADNLAERTALILSGQVVITRASETHKVPSPDLLGREHSWEIQNRKHLRAASTAMVAGDPVAVVQHAGEMDWIEGGLPPHIHLIDSLEEYDDAKFRACLLISDGAFDPEADQLPDVLVVYRPKTLAIGIDCPASTKADLIQMAITKTLMEHGLSFRSIRNLATADTNQNIPGLQQFAARHHLPIEFLSEEVSDRGAGTRAAALQTARSEELLIEPVEVSGQITLAVARRPFSMPVED